MAEVMEIDCPVCDTGIDYELRKKAWFGECPYCGTRVYTSQMGMDRALSKIREAKKDAGKAKGKASA